MNRIFNKSNLISYVMLTIGAIIAAFALGTFLSPNNIFDGGIVGVSMILARLFDIKLGILVVLINIPFLIFGIKTMGVRFLIKAAYSMVLFSVMTTVFEEMGYMTEDVFLAACFGGVLLGCGVGLVLRAGGCLDGTEIVALYLSKKFSMSVGQIILIFNVFIYSIAGYLFGMDRGMYSLVMYFITSKVIDIVEVGMDNAKSVMIISANGQELADKIFKELGRTVTFIHGEGFLSGKDMNIVYCVVTRAEIFELKSIVKSVPGSSFTTISDVSEIVGNHIKSA